MRKGHIPAPLPILLVTALMLLPEGAAPAPAPGPRLTIPVARLQASDPQTWNVPFVVENTWSTGLYVDSMVCEVENLDAGETRAPRRTRFPLLAAAKLLPSMSAGDHRQFQCAVNAPVERAHLTFFLYVHAADHRAQTLSASLEADPGPASLEFPSRFLTVGGKRVEYVLAPPGESAAAPGLLLIHGHGSHARVMIPRARGLAQRGYVVMAASMPGYGQSDGPADFMGPATQRAMMAALDRLKRSPGVDSTRLAVWGISRGASVAVDLAEQRTDLKCAIAQSGMYDLWAVYRGTKVPGIRELLVAEAGADSAAWRARSPALTPERVHAALLLLHGEQDDRVPCAQARGFFEALKARGAEVEARFIPEAGHSLAGREADRTALEFLARQLQR